MPTPAQKLVAGSTIPTGTPAQHICNLGGGYVLVGTPITATMTGDQVSASVSSQDASGSLAIETISASISGDAINAAIVSEQIDARMEVCSIQEFLPEQPPFYGDTLFAWLDAAWPAGQDSVRTNYSYDDLISKAPEDRSPSLLEGMRVYVSGDPPTWNSSAAGLNRPSWEFDQTQTNGRLQGFQNTIGENNGNGLAGDTGPRWTAMIVIRDDNTVLNQARYIFRFNTPYLQGWPSAGDKYNVRGLGNNGTLTTIDQSPNNCYVLGITFFGDQTQQVWVNGVKGPRADLGFYWGVGINWWMGQYTTQANSFKGAIPLVNVWEEAYDPATDGLYAYARRRFPGTFSFPDVVP